MTWRDARYYFLGMVVGAGVVLLFIFSAARANAAEVDGCDVRLIPPNQDYVSVDVSSDGFASWSTFDVAMTETGAAAVITLDTGFRLAPGSYEARWSEDIIESFVLDCAVEPEPTDPPAEPEPTADPTPEPTEEPDPTPEPETVIAEPLTVTLRGPSWNEHR